MTDVRAAAQLSALASLLTIAVPSLIAFNVIHATLALTVGLAAALLLLDRLGWRIVAVMFGCERLITGTPVIRDGPPALAAISADFRGRWLAPGLLGGAFADGSVVAAGQGFSYGPVIPVSMNLG
jgi:hypothetical protein